MRRPRHKVHVDTFPFLAVLLAAMGSLILLLFIVDRRAKIVERNKARDRWDAFQTARADKLVKLEAERQAKWQAQRDALHQDLSQKHQSLGSEKSSLERELKKAEDTITSYRIQQHLLEMELAKTSAELEKEKTALKQKQDGTLGALTRAEQAKRAELAQLTDEMLRMEQMVKNLKLRKTNEPEVFSLIPYKGKRGDQRKPLYVECVGDGLLFHPERSLLQGARLTFENIRDEVERRGMQRDGASRNDLYVLFLIRPSGVKTYSLARSSLAAYKVDFGYELVDDDWIFDFSQDDAIAKMVARKEEKHTILPSTAPRGTPKVQSVQLGNGRDISLPPPPGVGIGGSGAGGNGMGGNGTGEGGLPFKGVAGGGYPGTGTGVPGGVPGVTGGGYPGVPGGVAGGTGRYPGTGTGVPGGVPGVTGGGYPGVPGGVAGGTGRYPGTGSGVPGGTGGYPGGTGGYPGVPGSVAGGTGTGVPAVAGGGYPGGVAGGTGGYPGAGPGVPGGTGGYSGVPGGTGKYPGTGTGVPGGVAGGTGGYPGTGAGVPGGTGVGYPGVPGGVAGGTGNPGNGPGVTGGTGGGYPGVPGGVADGTGTGVPGGTSGGYPGVPGGVPGGTGGGVVAGSSPVVGGVGAGGNVASQGGNGTAQGGLNFGPAPAQLGSIVGGNGQSGGSHAGPGVPGGVTGGNGLGGGQPGQYSGGTSGSGQGYAQGGGQPGQFVGGGTSGGGQGNAQSSGQPGQYPGGTPGSGQPFGGQPNAGTGGTGSPPNGQNYASGGQPSQGQPGSAPPAGSRVPGDASDPFASNEPRPAGSKIAPPSFLKPKDPNGGESGGPEDPLARLTPTVNAVMAANNAGAGPRVQPRPLTVGRVVGNRDFIITIECDANLATIFPTGKEFDMADAQDAKAIDQDIVRLVQQLVARRQATVQPGEPPYRPRLRLQVKPDGTRTYYRIYPLLMNLGIPMGRDNVDS